MMALQIKQAACVVITDGDMALAVTRKDNQTMFAFPGGKVDPGENTLQAAVRELREETGVEVTPESLIPVYGAITYGDDGNHYYTQAYMYVGPLDVVIPVQVEPDIIPLIVETTALMGNTEIELYNMRVLEEIDLLMAHDND